MQLTQIFKMIILYWKTTTTFFCFEQGEAVLTSIIGQIGHCIGGNFYIHIWAWSDSPSVREFIEKSNSVNRLECCQRSATYMSNSVNLEKVVLHSYFLAKNM